LGQGPSPASAPFYFLLGDFSIGKGKEISSNSLCNFISKDEFSTKSVYTLALNRQPLNSGAMSIHKDRAISLSALSLIFSELVQYQSIKICSAIDMELALERVGRTIGTKVLELLSYRERSFKRGDGVIGILQVRLDCSYAIIISFVQFISSSCWKVLFGKVADSLERSTENENECTFTITTFWH